VGLDRSSLSTSREFVPIYRSIDRTIEETATKHLPITLTKKKQRKRERKGRKGEEKNLQDSLDHCQCARNTRASPRCSIRRNKYKDMGPAELFFFDRGVCVIPVNISE